MPVEASVKKELQARFGTVESEHEDVWEKLSSLTEIFNLSVEDLYINWETFNVTKVKDDLPLTSPNLDALQEYLQSSLAAKTTPAIKKSRDLQSSGLKIKPMKRPTQLTSSPSIIPSTPNLKRRKPNEQPSSALNSNFVSSPAGYDTANETFPTSSPIKKRPDPEANSIIETLNPHIDGSEGYSEDDETAGGVKLAANFDSAKFKFRTMSMKLLEAADVLDDQIDSFAQLYQESHPDSDIPFGNPCMSSQNDIICSGRIVPDSPMDDTSLNYTPNKSSLFLETSRLAGIGQRIPLDLSHLREFALFPGQIVILKGNNPTGSSFVVKEVITPPSLGLPVSAKEELEEYKTVLGDSKLKVLVASGPYSNNKTLDYEQLSNLTDRINDEIKPNVVILLGPFLDINNEAVASGEIPTLPNEKQPPKTLDEVFKKIITPILKKINPKIQTILIPSLSDSCVKHCSYPQDAFDRKRFGLPKNIKVFPNPSSFSINEVLIGCSNMDIFEDLKDIHQGNSDSKVLNNRFERIANHIFEQRRYYPYFPGSIRRSNLSVEETGQLTSLENGIFADDSVKVRSGGSSLEVPYLGLTELGASLPDIMICPSKFKSFAKVIKGVIVINPGYFVRGNQGTYGILSIVPPDVNESENVEPVDETSDQYYHNVFKRARVDILKS